MAEAAENGPFYEISREEDAGAAFVLQSKGKWWHAGFHLTTAIVGPTILTLPYAFRGLGWGLGFLCLTAMGVVTFYSYYLMSLVLDHCEKAGRRHIRFRELAADVLGRRQLIPASALELFCWLGNASSADHVLKPLSDGPLKLYHFIAMVTVVMILLSQFPSFHSLRHINFVSLLLSLGYTFLVVGACITAGASKNAPRRDYSLESSESSRVFSAFTSISIIAAIFGNGILPEIQATLAPPATGKMVKGLIMCYTVIFFTFYSAAVSGYWVFGNKSNSNILKSLMPDEGPSFTGMAFRLLLQLLAIGLKLDPENNSPLYVVTCGFFAAMLPFFGDISAVVGAVGFIPLDFVLPMLLYNMTHKPRKSSLAYWVNYSIIVVFSCVGLMGAFSSIRKLVQDAKQFKLFSSDVVD
ncbi:putative GABA transporter 2 [Sesamum angolense]|uniref:GABA transporter 2 n=1 Tax=Sesamum angolense TaxID=2727404 RepID=A0AAE1W9F0_9LAMI|nr:putative GABA transporter 2 [Sesamum angolense]